MSDKVYVAQAGFVQFDPQQREANGQKVVDFTIKCVGKPINVRVTLWPELKAGFDKVKKGDFVAVEGTFSQSSWQDDDGTKRVSNQISAYNLVVNGEKIDRAERDVVASDSGDDSVPF